MPPPREQPNPPGKGRRRPDVVPSGWIWLVLLIVLVFALLVTMGFGNAANINYSNFWQLAQKGKDKDQLQNTNIKKVVFIGLDKIEGELQESASLNETQRQQ